MALSAPTQASVVNTYRWKQTGWWRAGWVLTEGERVVAEIEPRGFGMMEAELHQGAHRWRIHLRGVMKWRLEVEDAAGAHVATMPLGWCGEGTIHLADGRSFAWEPETPWGNRWRLRALDGAVLAHARTDRWLESSARIDIVRPRLAEDELSLLLAVGWFGTVVATMGTAGVITG